jgi:hypothetical protein
LFHSVRRHSQNLANGVGLGSRWRAAIRLLHLFLRSDAPGFGSGFSIKEPETKSGAAQLETEILRRLDSTRAGRKLVRATGGDRFLLGPLDDIGAGLGRRSLL